MATNPFIQDMVRLKLPEGMGSMLSIGGFMMEADKEGCIEVPSRYVNDLRQQGLRDAGPAAAGKK